MKVAICFVLLFSIAVFGAQNYDGVSIKKATRSIDLHSQFSLQNVTLSVTNTGSKAISEVYLALEAKQAKHLSFLEVYLVETGQSLPTSAGETVDRESGGQKSSFVHQAVSLAKPLEPQGTVEIRATYVFTHTMVPFPAQISQTEKQLVKYYDNVFVASPYTIQTQTTTIKLGSARIEHRTESSPSNVKGDVVTYGPFLELAPHRYTELFLHFENNAPFITVTRMVKEYEVSHWGNVAVEEQYELQHDGAKLKGAFSRYDYQRSGGNAPSHVPVLRQVLPLSASDIYYRDEIGNISTSHISLTERGLTLDLVPRFPLFGGWKFGFYMGYNLPAHDYLFNDASSSSTYILNVTMAAEFDNVAIDELNIRIILPEGASNIEVKTPFPIDEKSSTTHFTYLDTVGRSVVILKKYNVVPQHNRYFQVTYKFSQLSMLQEPFLLIVAFFLFFLVIMVYVRLEFHIGPVRQRSPNADKVDDLLLKVKDYFDQRAELHQSLDNALTKAIKSKNRDAYNTEKSRLDNSLTLLRKEVQKEVVTAEDLDGEVARKLRDIERKEDAKAKAQLQLHKAEIAFRFDKAPKGAYEETKAESEKAYATADEELESLISDLTENL